MNDAGASAESASPKGKKTVGARAAREVIKGKVVWVRMEKVQVKVQSVKMHFGMSESSGRLRKVLVVHMEDGRLGPI